MNREQIQGYNFIAGAGSDQATFIIKLKPFSERQKGFWWKLSGLWQGDGIYRFFLNPYESTGVIAQIFLKTAHIKDAQILAFAPPMIPGFSASSGVSLVMQDRTGGDLNKFFGIVKEYLEALNKRPEFQMAMTSYNPNYPQYMVNINVAKCKQAGISPTTVLSTLQGYYGGLYASNFNSYGKLYRVMIQGTPESRMSPESLNNIYVRTPNGMSPVQEYCSLERVYGPTNINRFNLFTAINVTATVADGYSTGEALKACQEVGAEVLPAGYTFDYQGLTREEAKASNTTAIIFVWTLQRHLHADFTHHADRSFGKECHPYCTVRPRAPSDRYGNNMVGSAGCRSPSASYIDDLSGYGSRSVAYDVRFRCGQER